MKFKRTSCYTLGVNGLGIDVHTYAFCLITIIMVSWELHMCKQQQIYLTKDAMTHDPYVAAQGSRTAQAFPSPFGSLLTSNAT